jgi:ankyrin repeat protein
MSTHSEANRLNLEYYRKKAKELLKAARAGDATAIARLSLRGGQEAALHDAQLTIAREQGFASWPRFRAFVVQSELDDPALVTAFIEAALSDRQRAKEMLKAHPKIARGGFYVALVLGDREGVERFDSLMQQRGGPRRWEPLAYLCFSRMQGEMAETARLLLRNGANPDESVLFDEYPDNPLSCLYGATGLNNNPELAAVLLEAGANPNDSESLYHSTEHRDLACMKLLLRNGAMPAGTNALKHMLDREDLEGTRLLLAASADPNEVNARGETALHWAVWRGRSAQVIETLIDHGAQLDARRLDGWTAYAMAVISTQTETAALLASLGANQEVPSPDSERLLPDLTMIHRTEAVRRLLAGGAQIDARGELGATALHWACWKGFADLVELLLEHGASLKIEDDTFHGTPPGWFGHGVKNCADGDGDYAEVARLLIAAKAKIPRVDLPTGRPEVDEVLRALGLI